MFKVLLVDDEEEVRIGIKNKIDWNHYGFEVIGEAENGREALDFFDESVPDIVITDINMPFMDGLELTAAIKDEYPAVKIIILTGFDDFKFAQTSIKYGVTDYILKPVLPKDINELLEKLKNQILSEIAEKEDIEKLRLHYQESLPVLKENFMVSLVLRKPTSEYTIAKINEMNIRLRGAWFAAAICKIDSESIKASGFTEDEIELKRFAVFNIIIETLEKHNIGETFILDDGIVIILGIDCKERTKARNKMFSVLDETRQSICKYLRLTVSIGLGRIYNNLEDIRESYLSSITARSYKLILSGNKVIFVEDLEPGVNNFFHLDRDKEEVLVASIKFRSEKEVTETVDSLFNELSETGASLKEYQLYFTEIISSLMKLARLFKVESSDVLPDKSDMYMEFNSFESIGHAKSWINELSINLMKNISRKRINTTQVLFEKARDHMVENFSDDELTIQKLSEILFISPSYLAIIFKKEAGETFLKFLMRIRLEKAKDLLLDSSRKIAEVAVSVGYPDVSYFSYFFKKNTGQSPREYKKKHSMKGIDS